MDERKGTENIVARNQLISHPDGRVLDIPHYRQLKIFKNMWKKSMNKI